MQPYSGKYTFMSLTRLFSGISLFSCLFPTINTDYGNLLKKSAIKSLKFKILKGS